MAPPVLAISVSISETLTGLPSRVATPFAIAANRSHTDPSMLRAFWACSRAALLPLASAHSVVIVSSAVASARISSATSLMASTLP